MSTYNYTLPKVFPIICLLTHAEAREAVTALMQHERADVPNGSSFALTVDTQSGKWKLWLSETSAAFIDQCVKEGMWKKNYRPDDMLRRIMRKPPLDDY